MEMKIPNTPIMAKEYFRLVSSAMNPISGGPIRNPKKLMLETIVKAMLVGTFSLFPATLIMIGTTFETPKPTSINAIMHGIK